MMEGIIIFVHFAAAAFFALYLILKLLVSFFTFRRVQADKKALSITRWIDWVFLTVLSFSGLYLVTALGRFEFYHLLKVLLVIAIVVAPKYMPLNKLLTYSLVGMIGLFAAFFLAFKKQPLFFTKKLVIENLETSEGEVAPDSSSKLGELVFQTVCTECHGDDGKLGKFQAIDLSTSTLTLEERLDAISNGRPVSAMRAFRHELTEEQIEAVARYIEVLRVDSL